MSIYAQYVGGAIGSGSYTYGTTGTASPVNGLTNMQYQTAFDSLQASRAFTETELARWQAEIYSAYSPQTAKAVVALKKVAKKRSFSEKLLDKYGTKEDV